MLLELSKLAMIFFETFVESMELNELQDKVIFLHWRFLD
jgi:hypothetical protein